MGTTSRSSRNLPAPRREVGRSTRYSIQNKAEPHQEIGEIQHMGRGLWYVVIAAAFYEGFGLIQWHHYRTYREAQKIILHHNAIKNLSIDQLAETAAAEAAWAA